MHQCVVLRSPKERGSDTKLSLLIIKCIPCTYLLPRRQRKKVLIDHKVQSSSLHKELDSLARDRDQVNFEIRLLDWYEEA